MESLLLSAQSLFGLVMLVLIAWALSERRGAVNWRMVVVAIGLQGALALLLLHVPVLRDALVGLSAAVEAVQAASNTGARFVFGFVAGGPQPFAVEEPGALVSLAFGILPLVIVIAALSALLWYWGILFLITRGFAWALERTLGIGGAAGLGAAANLFMGMIEAPLFIRAYLSKLTRSELFLVMTVGLATVSGTVLVLYAVTIGPVVEGAVGHILVASFLSLPAAVLISKVMVPGEEVTPSEAGLGELGYQSSVDAVVQGTQEGLKLFLTIIAMLIVVIAMVALTDSLLALLPGLPDATGAVQPITVERIFGWLFAPLVWLFGVPWSEAGMAGTLMGTKTILNEFIAYQNLASPAYADLSDRSRLIMLYAMCGFANLGSVGMLISTLSTLVPERRAEVVGLGMKSLIAGTLATGMTGAVVGLLP